MCIFNILVGFFCYVTTCYCSFMGFLKQLATTAFKSYVRLCLSVISMFQHAKPAAFTPFRICVAAFSMLISFASSAVVFCWRLHACVSSWSGVLLMLVHAFCEPTVAAVASGARVFIDLLVKQGFINTKSTQPSTHLTSGIEFSEFENVFKDSGYWDYCILSFYDNAFRLYLAYSLFFVSDYSIVEKASWRGVGSLLWPLNQVLFLELKTLTEFFLHIVAWFLTFFFTIWMLLVIGSCFL